MTSRTIIVEPTFSTCSKLQAETVAHWVAVMIIVLCRGEIYYGGCKLHLWDPVTWSKQKLCVDVEAVENRYFDAFECPNTVNRF